ncbi:MAG: alpha/beta fold hydrolase [Burkholderiaceae bacterium]|nr:MAG: alpha/beta fold hydrolase [Burkholderiaceae bacterium]
MPSSLVWPTLNGAGSLHGIPNWMTLLEKMPQPDLFKQFEHLSDGPIKIPLEKLNAIQAEYLQNLTHLWQSTFGQGAASLQKTFLPGQDRRFSAPAWNDNGMYEFNASLYLLYAKTMLELAEAVEAEPKVKNKIRFAIEQWIDAASPSNYLVSNPEAQQKIIETQGESLMQGMENLLHDVRQGRISQTDESQFEVGRNVATTPGAVVFENELFQLIQYTPTTEQVGSCPLLIVPPCINKFYILDLQPENSLTRFCVEQGVTTFLVSWVNPSEQLAKIGWDDYIEEGVIEAIRTVKTISGQPRINTLGFCVGGTLLATAISVLEARQQHLVESVTFLTTLLDFTDTGLLDVYVDEASVQMREQTMGKGGLMPGRELAAAFASLRSNDLVWNYVVKNYLKGESPPAFDLLYWNSDSTNLPGPMYSWYLRNTYLENNLVVPGKVKCCGTPVDFGRINVPTYILAAREDHIVPWHSAFASTRLIARHPAAQDSGGDHDVETSAQMQSSIRFVLGASGHIAGVVNPASKNKRSYWTNETLTADADDWLAGATEHKGSWWNDWSSWLRPHVGESVAASSKLGSRGFKPIEPAPGRYVKARA